MANTAYIQGMGKVNVAPADYYKSSAAQISSGGSKGLAGATITAGVLSGIADIATALLTLAGSGRRPNSTRPWLILKTA